MMYLGDKAVGLVNNTPLPSFFNNLESGSFIATKDNITANGEYDIQLSTITKPQGIIVFTHSLNCLDAKSEKPLLGAFATMYIRPADAENLNQTNGWTILSGVNCYVINWGNGTGAGYPQARTGLNDSGRGIYLFNETTKTLRLRYFTTSQGDYDFKYNIPYHWIAWD